MFSVTESPILSNSYAFFERYSTGNPSMPVKHLNPNIKATHSIIIRSNHMWPSCCCCYTFLKSHDGVTESIFVFPQYSDTHIYINAVYWQGRNKKKINIKAVYL